MTEPGVRPATASPSLRHGEVQIWRLDPALLLPAHPLRQPLLERCYGVLSVAERERAARLRAGVPQDEFIAGRGSLRSLLGAMLHCDPRHFEFLTGAHGKLFLSPGLRTLAPPPEFNVAHSAGMVLIALSCDGSVGIDVECVDRTAEVVEIAHASFHAQDVQRIEAAGSIALQQRLFYACWTRREALAKADGRGLTLPLHRCRVGCDDGAEELRVELPAREGAQPVPFFVRAIDAGVGYPAALAAATPNLRTVLFDLGGWMLNGAGR